MKFKSLSAAALVAVIGAGTLLPMAASASTTVEGDPYQATGSVTIEAGNIDPTNPIPDPEIPGETVDPVTPIVPNPNPGNLGIVRVSPLDFGTIQLSSRERVYPAAAVAVNKETAEGGTREATRGHLIQFEDARGTREGYTVIAEMTRQFTLEGTTGETAETLGGSIINYTNGIITNDTDAVIPTTFASSFELSEDGGAEIVVDAAEGEGSGEFMLEYGQSTDYNTDPAFVATDAESVFLTIPDATFSSMLAGNYEAEITWSILNEYTAPTPGA